MTELAMRNDRVQPAIRSSTVGRGDHFTESLKTDQTSGRAETQGANGRGFFEIIDGSYFITKFRMKLPRLMVRNTCRFRYNALGAAKRSPALLGSNLPTTMLRTVPEPSQGCVNDAPLP